MANKRILLEKSLKTQQASVAKRAATRSGVGDALHGPDGRMMVLPLDQVRPRNNPRTEFDEASLQELAATIKKNGVIQPIIVREEKNGFVIIAGERRWRAAKIAGLKEIPAMIRQEGDALALALIENVQRTDLGPKDLSKGVSALKEQHGYTDEQLGAILGKSRSRISEIMALNRLPDRVFSEMSDVRHPLDVLLLVAREPNEKAMLTLWEQIKETGSATVKAVRALKKNDAPGKNSKKGYTFRHKGPDYALIIQFAKDRVAPETVQKVLKEAMGILKNSSL